MEKKHHQKITIIGAGWYGLYIAKKLLEKGEGYNSITIIDKGGDILDENASRYNQCRLHLGFHYPRSFETRELCREGYYKFLNEFREVTYEIPNNWYVISEQSMLDYKTFNSIYTHEKYDFDLIDTSTHFNFVDGNKAFCVQEQGINPKRVAEYFKRILHGRVTFLFNHKVEFIKEETKTIAIEGSETEIPYDICFDCSNFQAPIGPALPVIFEKTLTMLYHKRPDSLVPFGALTVMDGSFFSIFPYDPDNNIYSLTHVKHTVLTTTDDEFNVQTHESRENIRKAMEHDVCLYYPMFLQHFDYRGFFESPKTKPISKSDSRRLMVTNPYEGVYRVSCGKITGIFQLEEMIERI